MGITGSLRKLNLDQIESAQRKTSEELKLYDQGRGELADVRDREGRIVQQRVTGALTDPAVQHLARV